MTELRRCFGGHRAEASGVVVDQDEFGVQGCETLTGAGVEFGAGHDVVGIAERSDGGESWGHPLGVIGDDDEPPSGPDEGLVGLGFGEVGRRVAMSIISNFYKRLLVYYVVAGVLV